MKTSNKILVTAIGIFLLFMVVDTAILLCDSNAVRKKTRNVFEQLERHRVRVLVVEGGVDDYYFRVFNMGGDTTQRQLLNWAGTMPDMANLRFSNDTLYYRNPTWGNASLPYLQSYLRNGQPQPIRSY